MPVILARRRIAGAEPPAVHAFRVPHNPAQLPVWRSVCGVELAAAEAEVVGQYVGAPCSVCLMATFGDQASRTTQAQRTRIGTRPVMQPVSPSGGYAVAMAGERMVHLVASGVPRSKLDGQSVVQALCGHLGWGPYITAPTGYDVCAECRGVQHGSRR